MTEFQERPWGGWKVVHEAWNSVVKVLTVNAGAMLSLQSHTHRSEFWTPLGNGLVAYVYEPLGSMPELAMGESRRATLLKPHTVFQVRQGHVHRLINAGAQPVDLVEIIVGKYDENDIKRFHDAYGRLEGEN